MSPVSDRRRLRTSSHACGRTSVPTTVVRCARWWHILSPSLAARSATPRTVSPADDAIFTIAVRKAVGKQQYEELLPHPMGSWLEWASYGSRDSRCLGFPR